MKVSKPIATTATIATFAIVGVTGVFMFFDLKNYGIKIAHEYIGMVMVLACVLHIFAQKIRGKGEKIIENHDIM